MVLNCKSAFIRALQHLLKRLFRSCPKSILKLIRRRSAKRSAVSHRLLNMTSVRDEEFMPGEESKSTIEIGRVGSIPLGSVFIRRKSQSELDTPRRRRARDKLKAFVNSSHRVSGAFIMEDDEIIARRSESFVFSEGFSTQEAELRLQKYGKNEIPEHIVPKWYIVVSQLWKPMPIMILMAVIIDAAIENYIDMAILICILVTNISISFYELTHADHSISVVKKSLKLTAKVKRDGKYVYLDSSLLVPGDLVLLSTGSAVPADCRVNQGDIDVDEASLTGELLPVTKFQGGDCLMGTTVVRGEVEATVEFTGAKTFFGKTAALLEETNEDGNFQKLLRDIVFVLLVLSVVLCFIVLMYKLQKTSVKEALAFTVVLLVASIPLAIEIVTTTTLALGSKKLYKIGATVVRLSAIEDLAGMSILCSDKSGTLTMNQMTLHEETPVFKEGESQSSLLMYAAMATKWEEPARNALDALVLKALDLSSLNAYHQTAYMPFDPIVKRTEATIRDVAAEKTFKTTKGAPHVILDLARCSCADIIAADELQREVERAVFALGARGIRSLAVAKTNDEDQWEILGLLTFLDPPRPDTKQTIAEANRYGVAVKMITGDHLLIARETARVLGMGDYVTNAEQLPLLDPDTKKKPANLAHDFGDMCLSIDGFAHVLPEHKYLIVECLRELGYMVGMTGDGVNDAPALMHADVGIAVAGATDAARAAADIVLTRPGLSTIVEGIIIARRTFMHISNFLTYRIAATLQLVFFEFIALFAFQPFEFMPAGWKTDPDFPDHHPWPHLFHMPVLMLMLITLLNDGTLMAVGHDNAKARNTPEEWNLPVQYVVASVLAAVSCLSSLLLLYLSLSSWKKHHVYQAFGIGGLSFGQIITSIYLKVSISDFLTLFSARTGPDWFWTTAPAPILLGAASLALTVSTIIACAWPEMNGHLSILGLARRQPYELVVYIWLYCLVWFVIQDAAKVGTYYLLKRYNVFGYNDTGKLVLPQSALKYIADHKENDLLCA